MNNKNVFACLLLSLAGIGFVVSSCTNVGNDSGLTTLDTTVQTSSISSWFVNNKITKDGVVTPADSLDSLTTDADFHNWSWRMFLWLMSKENSSLVLDSAGFFDLSLDNKLVANDGGSVNPRFIRNGQAGMAAHGVLMSQSKSVTPNGSLVYYGIHVNDTFAYYASGVKTDPAVKALKNFPTTQAELDVIKKFAKDTYNAELKNPNTLTMEFKSSWVEVASASAAGDYITIQAQIPSYTVVNSTQWTWDGKTTKTATLALVGLHIVGSTKDHPEMVWATFEHEGNSPDANYTANGMSHNDFGTNFKPVSSDWLFYDSSIVQSQANIQRMNLITHNNNTFTMQAIPGKTIGAASAYRVSPWGNSPDDNKQNTLLVNLNNNVRSQLINGDVRKKYFLLGSVWTNNGVPGQNNSIPELAGSSRLANSTMETFTQSQNCFSCHTTQHNDSLSHILPIIKPLTPPSQ